MDETQADLEDAQVTAVIAIHEMAQASVDGATADRDQTNI